jgi:hypothetical protein
VEFSERVDQKVLLDMHLRLPVRVTKEDVLVTLGDLEGVDDARWEA